MTWNDLNEWTDDMMPDMLGQAWYDLVDDGGDDMDLFSCQALDMTIEVLEDIRHDMPDDHDAEYLEYTSMVKRLRAVR